MYNQRRRQVVRKEESSIRNYFRISSHTTEIFSSLLRWFFVFVAYFPPFAPVIQDSHQFSYLVVFSLLHMTITQFVLHFCKETSRTYYILTRGGVVLDYFAFLWLLHLSGGFTSPFFPIAYLLAIHAAIYWYLGGAVGAAFAIFAGYTMLLVVQDFDFTGTQLVVYLTRITFVFLISLYGGILASKERIHYIEKNYYQNQAIRDYLTGLYNHRHFQETIKDLVARHTPFYLIMADIDDFKQVNDVHGHVTGDTVLKGIAELLSRRLPTSKGSVSRYGGEEFSILLPSSSLEEVQHYIHQVMNELEAVEFEAETGKFKVTLSFGVTNYQLTDQSNDVVRRADQRLYLAKQQGRNRVLYSNDIAF